MITMVKFRLEVLWWWGQYTQDHFHIWQQYQQWFLLIPSKPNDQLCCPGATALHEDHRHEFSEFSHFSMCTFTHLAKLVQIRILFTVFENYLKKSHFILQHCDRTLLSKLLVSQPILPLFVGSANYVARLAFLQCCKMRHFWGICQQCARR